MPTFRVAVPYDRVQETRMSAEEDAALVARYGRSRDREALDEIVRRHWPLAYRLALRCLVDPAAAEDAAQEAFVALVRGARKFDEARPFGPWFRTLVMNAVRMSRRARERRQRHEERAAFAWSPSAPALDEALLAREVEEHVSRLPKDERFAIVMHFYEGHSHEEVATVLGCPRGTASSRIRRGLGRLRESMAGAGYAGSLDALERLLASPRGVVSVPPPSSIALEALAAKAVPWMAGGLAIKVAAILLVVCLAASAVFVSRNRPPAQMQRDQAVAPAQSQDAGRTVRQDGVKQDGQQGGEQGTTGQGTASPVRDGAEGKPIAAPPSTLAAKGPGFLVTVTDASGKPVPGARVEARRENRDGAFAELLGRMPVQCLSRWDDSSVIADANGQAFLGGLKPITVEHVNGERVSGKVVLVAVSGVDEAASEGLPLPSDVASVGLVLRSPSSPKTGCGSVVLTVKTPAGPLASTKLSGTFFVIFGTDMARMVGAGFDGETDPDGRLVLHDLQPGSDSLSIMHENYQEEPVDFRVDAGRETDKTILLEPGAVLAGRVCLADGSTPGHVVAGWHLKALDDRTIEQGRIYSSKNIHVYTNGSYRTEALPPGLYTVKAWAPGYCVVAVDVPAHEPRTIAIPDLVLGQQGATVAGRVSGPGGPESFIILEDADRNLLGVARASADGRFAIACVPEGTTRVLFMSGTGAEEQVLGMLVNGVDARAVLLTTVQVPAQGELSLGDLGAASSQEVATFKGRVFGPDGQPIAGASFTVASTGTEKTAASDAQGAFEILGLAPGDDSLRVTSGDLVNLQPTSVHLVAGENDQDVTLAPGGSVSGTVSPLPENAGGLAVVAYACGPGDAPAPADRSISPVGQNGRYHLRALRPGRYKVLIPSFHEPVEVTVVSGREETLDLSLTSGTGEIVVNVQGKAAVSAMALRGTLDFRSMVLDPLAQATFTDGKAVLGSIPQGTVTVLVMLQGGTPQDDNDRLMLFREGLTVGTASHQEIDLAVPDQAVAGSISGQVSPAPDKQGAQCMVLARGDGVLLTTSIKADGSFTIPTVPPGRYTVEALSMEAMFADKLSASGVEVTVLAKQAASVSLTLK